MCPVFRGPVLLRGGMIRMGGAPILRLGGKKRVHTVLYLIKGARKCLAGAATVGGGVIITQGGSLETLPLMERVLKFICKMEVGFKQCTSPGGHHEPLQACQSNIDL